MKRNADIGSFFAKPSTLIPRTERIPMLLDPKPVYRRVILPWYDSEIVCIATLLFAGFVLLFAVFGIHVAYETPDYRQYLWIPGLLFTMGLAVFVSVAVRLINRYVQWIDR
jgi:hypothetical protein